MPDPTAGRRCVSDRLLAGCEVMAAEVASGSSFAIHAYVLVAGKPSWKLMIPVS